MLSVDKLEEWIASSMSAESTSEVIEPAAAIGKKDRLPEIRVGAPAADDRIG